MLQGKGRKEDTDRVISVIFSLQAPACGT